jgi:hypothetical protein
LHAVIQSRVVQDLHDRVNRSRPGIVGTIDQAPDARMHQRAGAHRTWFNCSKQLAVSQAMVTNDCTRFAEGDDFGVSAGVVLAKVAIPAAGDNAPAADDNRPDGNFSGFSRAVSSTEGLLHVEFVVKIILDAWSLPFGHERSRPGRSRAGSL